MKTTMPSSTTPEMEKIMWVLLVQVGTVTMSTSRITACIYTIKGATG
jgi:hypothetical protein